jgi:hypothetical protein
VNGSDVFDVVVLIHHDRHMVREAGREECQEKSKKRGNPVKSHKHIRFERR